MTRTCVPGSEWCFAPPGDGYPCLTDQDCDSESDNSRFCDHPDCGDQGYCSTRAYGLDECALLQPVCGCDGADYLNPCAAHGAGQSVAHEGTCQGP